MCDFIEAIDSNWPEARINPGICPTCADCQSDFGMSPRAFYFAYESGEICDEGGFSWRACDSCGSTLGGDRYAAHAIDDEGITHISICVDCLCFHANGDIPEQWEG